MARLTLVYLLIASTLLVGCKSQNSATSQNGEKRLIVYCSGPEHRTDDSFFRSSAVGESLDQMTSKKLAVANAKEELAGYLNTRLESLTDLYTGQTETGTAATGMSAEKRDEFTRVFKSLSQAQVSQTLDGIRIICEEQTISGNNMYKTYVALEFPKDEFLRRFTSSIESDDRIRAEYDYEKFKATFNDVFRN